MAVVNLTEARIRDLPLGSGIHRDEQVKGLMVICHKTTKTYACQGDVRRNGRHVRTVRATIDRVDRISLKDARARAKGLMSQIQCGIDPTERPEESGITLERALDAHLEDNRLRPRTEESYRYTLDHYLKPWRKKAVADISRQMVRGLDGKDRASVVNKTVSGYRAELIRDTAEPRKLLTRELEQLRRSVQSASTHYRSPIQMLMRDTLGSERRSRIMQQVAASGPAELASLAEFAAAQKDKELAAALCSRAPAPRAPPPKPSLRPPI